MRKGKKRGGGLRNGGDEVKSVFYFAFFSSSCVVRLGLGLKIQLSVYNCLDK